MTSLSMQVVWKRLLLLGVSMALLAASNGAIRAQERGARGAAGQGGAGQGGTAAGEAGTARDGRWRRSPASWYREISGPTPPDRWPGSVIEFIRDMEKNPPPQEAVLFAGSATIAVWPTEKNFPEYKSIRRGFGGSSIPDSTFYADRLIVPCKPSTIVMYSGDNDVFGGKSPYQTTLALEEFIWKINFELPNTQIVYISIRPSISRWNMVGQFREANKQIQEMIKKYDFVSYVDIDPITIGEDGMPRKDFFSADDLHLSPLGYEKWSEQVRPVLAKAEARYKELKAKNPVNAPRLTPVRAGRGAATAK